MATAKLTADHATVVKEQVDRISRAHNSGTIDHEQIDDACNKLLELTEDKKSAKAGDTPVKTDAPAPTNP